MSSMSGWDECFHEWNASGGRKGWGGTCEARFDFEEFFKKALKKQQLSG